MVDLIVENMGYGATYLDDMAIGKKMLDVLEKYYANHAWIVDCNHESGHATIQLMYEGNNKEVKVWKYGFLLHLNKLNSDNLEMKVMRAGGEILERYGMARKQLSDNDIIDFRDAKIDTLGMVM